MIRARARRAFSVARKLEAAGRRPHVRSRELQRHLLAFGDRHALRLPRERFEVARILPLAGEFFADRDDRVLARRHRAERERSFRGRTRAPHSARIQSVVGPGLVVGGKHDHGSVRVGSALWIPDRPRERCGAIAERDDNAAEVAVAEIDGRFGNIDAGGHRRFQVPTREPAAHSDEILTRRHSLRRELSVRRDASRHSRSARFTVCGFEDDRNYRQPIGRRPLAGALEFDPSADGEAFLQVDRDVLQILSARGDRRDRPERRFGGKRGRRCRSGALRARETRAAVGKEHGRRRRRRSERHGARHTNSLRDVLSGRDANEHERAVSVGNRSRDVRIRRHVSRVRRDEMQHVVGDWTIRSEQTA